ncbi:hypothetical protein C266_00195 [Pandoraea sp. SD6-2]|nr:hypothetical protein C266_00195 [Pandoraea sp. SD6-2]
MTKSPGNRRICDINATERPYFGTFAMHLPGKRRKLGACEFSALPALLALLLATQRCRQHCRTRYGGAQAR